MKFPSLPSADYPGSRGLFLLKGRGKINLWLKAAID
jgi:hypothetical protein